jgi:broad specificity phosphatase PhoE
MTVMTHFANLVRAHVNMQLIIVRHAQSANNVLHEGEQLISRAEFERLRSHDPPLSALGEEQIKDLGKGIKLALKKPLSPKVRESRKVMTTPFKHRVHVAVSPMQRALRTAVPVVEAIREQTEVGEILMNRIEIVPFIHEIGGCYSERAGVFVGHRGMGNKQALEILTGACTDPSMDDGWWKTSSRETEEELEIRVTHTIEWIRKKAWEGECDALVIVTHQDFACLCLRRLVQASGISWLYNTSLTCVTLTPIVTGESDPDAIEPRSDGGISWLHHCKVTVDWINSVEHLTAAHIS